MSNTPNGSWWIIASLAAIALLAFPRLTRHNPRPEKEADKISMQPPGP